METKPWQIAIHKSTMYVIEQKTALLHLFNITDKLTHPTESLRFGSGSICLGVTSPKIEVLTVEDTTILILSNSGFKRGYEDLMYCVFAIATRPERQLIKLTSLSGRTGDYFLKVRQTPKHGTLFCFYNEQEISLEVVEFLRTEIMSRHDTFNQYSLTSLALIDSNPFHHVMTNFHNVDYWIDPQDGLDID